MAVLDYFTKELFVASMVTRMSSFIAINGSLKGSISLGLRDEFPIYFHGNSYLG
ncbi:hypothetical protein VPHD292_0050 [Vibrio phage D292]